MHSSSCLVLTLLSFGFDAVLHAQSSQSLLPPLLAKAFLPFAAKVKVHFDARWLYIESDGMPDHEMMTGIRAWQQQVPLPQPFTGDNAWQVPIKPVPSAMPMSVKTGFFRGAIAIAVNGVPIFNPIKNDGKTDTLLAGELDLFGGHAGRGDDYHYHVAPVFLNDGDPSRPVAFALDGYPIYGFTEPDGKPVRKLDEQNGHEDQKLGYHYHATKGYPYLNGGFHGEVTEAGGQVDPQPHDHAVRTATTPLRGAKITSFAKGKDGNSYTLTYDLRGKQGTVRYELLQDGAVHFVFRSPDGAMREETYRGGPPRGGVDGRPRAFDPPRQASPVTGEQDPAKRKPWLAAHLAEIDADKDKVLTLQELIVLCAAVMQSYDRDRNGKIEPEERDVPGAGRSAMGGFVKEHWSEVDADHDGVVTDGEVRTLATAMFEKADHDGDGSATEAELNAPQKPPQDVRRGSRAEAETDRANGPPKGPTTGDEVPFHVVLGRATDHSITVSVLSRQDIAMELEYGTVPNVFSQRTSEVNAKAKIPVEVELQPLATNTRYYYRVRFRGVAEPAFRVAAVSTFMTQRAAGSEFVFAVQGDSHPERPSKMFNGDLYRATLRLAAQQSPDFYVTLGDDFSVERLITSRQLTQVNVNALYAEQRSYLTEVGRSAPLFLVNGNHEEAGGFFLDGTSDNPAVISGLARTTFFPLPAPDSFYSADRTVVEHVGLLRDYYAFTWGDALFVMLDNYWHSPVQVDHDTYAQQDPRQAKNRDLWLVSIGDTQYHWLESTLANSKAAFKFVFAHHVLGTGRGGVELADQYEWGGRDRRLVDQFAEHRPGWSMPIHQLFVKHGVSIFFQGHDHLYARQEKDGVIYQETANPADQTYAAHNQQAYRSGTILPNSGFLRVTVKPGLVRVDYVRSFLPKDETVDQKSGAVAHSYVVKPRAAGN
ncbi:MAG: YHYH protein [Planctomycetota bacterium]|jgi:hypothetical protein